MTSSIIGNGRVGGALAARSVEHGISVHLIDRHDGWHQLDCPAGAPILVSTRNDDLASVVGRLPEHRRPDIVLIQNGMLRPWLEQHELSGVTRGLLFFAVPKRGAAIETGPPSPFFGPHADAVVQWMQRLDVPAEVVSEQAFKALELEKLIWNAAFGLLCQRFECSVGEVVQGHDETLRELVAEMLDLGAPALGVELDLAALLKSLQDYSLSIADYRGSVKEWPWRNGWFVDLAKGHGLDSPLHHRLLAEIGRGI